METTTTTRLLNAVEVKSMAYSQGETTNSRFVQPPAEMELNSLHPLQPRQPPLLPGDQVVFDDDEQLARPAGSAPPDIAMDESSAGEEESSAGVVVVVKTHIECSAIAMDDSSRDNFAVLVHLKAPGVITGGAAGRAPVDLVTVLDVSMSMKGSKLALVKQAMGFVIDSLGPGDRLCVVSFSSRPCRVTRLTRMSDAGKGLCARAVESLVVSGGTNIADGLRTAAKVLDERRCRNAVSSVVLLTDGQDNYTMMRMRRAFGREASYEALIPPSLVRRAGAGDWSSPVHTFGFGNDHDAAAMHAIAEATSGTFSFIENEAAIQDAFAQCIGGLLSVVVQEARIAVDCAHPGVRITCVKSGRYESRVDNDGRAASVGVGELYADEERRFLLFLVVPRAEQTDGETALVKVTCSYRDAASGAAVDVTAEDTVVARPEHVADSGRGSLEVERERVRVEATEDMAAARAAAERGAHREAVEILENRRRAVEQSEAARSGDPMAVALEMELREMRVRVSNRLSYGSSGRAYMLAGMGAHMQQRAGSGQMLLGATTPYATPAMLAMLRRSRELREASSADNRQ